MEVVDRGGPAWPWASGTREPVRLRVPRYFIKIIAGGATLGLKRALYTIAKCYSPSEASLAIPGVLAYNDDNLIESTA